MEVMTKDTINGIEAFYKLVFLDESTSEPVRVIQRTRQTNAIRWKQHNGKKQGFLLSVNNRKNESLSFDLVLAYPEHLGKLYMLDLGENMDRLPEVDQLPGPGSSPWTKAKGEEMKSADLDAHWSLRPASTHAVGWRVRNVQPSHRCGVIFTQ